MHTHSECGAIAVLVLREAATSTLHACRRLGSSKVECIVVPLSLRTVVPPRLCDIRGKHSDIRATAKKARIALALDL